MEVEALEEALHLSISHNQEVVVAVASTIDHLGVDVEEIRASIAEIRHDFCSENETRIIEGCVEVSIYKSLTHLWSIKEAVRKLAGADQLAMSETEVVEARNENEYLLAQVIVPGGASYRSVSYFSGKQVFAFAREDS